MARERVDGGGGEGEREPGRGEGGESLRGKEVLRVSVIR